MKKAEMPKKKGKLLLQIGLIFTSFFVLISILNSIFFIRNTRSTYFGSKEELLTRFLLREEETLRKIGEFTWFLDYWEAHPDRLYMMSDLADYNLIEEENITITDETVNLNREQLDALAPDVQEALARITYQSFSWEMNLMQWQLDTEKLFCIDTRKPDTGFVYVRTQLDNDTMNEISSGDMSGLISIGETIDTSSFSSIKVMNKTTYSKDSKEVYYERYDDSENDAYYYYGFRPVIVDGKVRCVIAIQHDWSDFHSDLSKHFVITVIGSVLTIMLIGGILLFFINRTAIRPVEKIQNGMQHYMQHKDSSLVAKDMETIHYNNEFGALAENLTLLAREIDRYTEENMKLTGEKERVATELSLAAGIQQGSLSTTFPVEKDFELYATMTPAKEVGGDLYDFFKIDEDHMGLVIGDVSGKGVPAALFMMMTQLLLRLYTRSESSPAGILKKTNEMLCENNKMEMFVTAWFGILDRKTGIITASSAGHEFPILQNKDGEFTLFRDPHGFVLGAMEFSEYTDYEFTLEPGCSLLVYTDGAPEATNHLEMLYGTDRMLNALNLHPDLGPKELTEALQESINKFVGDAPQFDDLTMLCLKYHGH